MRIGSIQYINSLPVDLGFTSHAVALSAEVVRGVPAVLNQQILDGGIDVGPVSSFWYAQHRDHFFILPEISISSESGAQSVLLFSRHPMRELAGKTIAITGEGRTTPVLLEILCRKLYGYAPRLKTLLSPFSGIPSEADAVLLIGNDALLHRQKLESAGFQVIDLAEEWRRWTGLGFVFALWVARREFSSQNPGPVNDAHRAILASKKWGLSHLDQVVAEARRQTGLADPVLRAYFSCLSYDLGASLARGMNLYFRYAEELGFLSKFEPIRYNELLSLGEK